MDPITPKRPRKKAGKEQHRKESYDRGLRVERWAGWIMRAKGFDILKRRYKAQGGEIDLICRKGDLVVFMESNIGTGWMTRFMRLRRAIKPGS